MVIDTNVYSALLRNSAAASEAIADADELKLPLPVLAELRFGFMKGLRQEDNESKLQHFLAQPRVSVLLPGVQTTGLYAELQLLCLRSGRVLSQNDLWIAAVAREADDVFATFDHDFEALRDVFEAKLIILE